MLYKIALTWNSYVLNTFFFFHMPKIHGSQVYQEKQSKVDHLLNLNGGGGISS